MVRQIQTLDAKMSKDGKKVKFSRVGRSRNVEVDNTSTRVEDVDKLKAYVMSMDKLIQFIPTTPGINEYNCSVGAEIELDLAVTNGIGDINIFNNSATVIISIVSGPGAIVGSSTPIFINGAASVKVKCNSAGEVIVGLSGGNTELDISDKAKIVVV